MEKQVQLDNPYLLLTPGPLSTTRSVREAMLRDWCTWDQEYNDLVQSIRNRLVALATRSTDQYTAVLMQGSGTFCVESVIGSVIPRGGTLLVLAEEGVSVPDYHLVLYPSSPAFRFQEFYERLKAAGFVIYPGKISAAETFQIGHIGDIPGDDIESLLSVIEENMFW